MERMIAVVVFGRIPKIAESVGEVIDGAILTVQRADNILRMKRKANIRISESSIMMSNQ